MTIDTVNRAFNAQTHHVPNFNLFKVLNQHSWQGEISSHDAEQLLHGKERGTYLTRQENKNTYMLSFVGESEIVHAKFTVLDIIAGTVKNCGPKNFGTIDQVIQMVIAEKTQAKPVPLK